MTWVLWRQHRSQAALAAAALTALVIVLAVTSTKIGRVRTCQLAADALAPAA